MKYIIQKGDSLSRIAKRLGMTVKDLADMNGIPEAKLNYIRAGDVLKIADRKKIEAIKQQVEQVTQKAPKEKAPTNPRQRAMQQRREAASTPSRGLMARSKDREAPQQEVSRVGENVGLTRKALEALGVNIDPFIIALDQAKLSVAETLLGKDSEIVKDLSKPITEKDLNTSVVNAMRENGLNMLREGLKSVDYVAQGTSRPGDIFETGIRGLLAPILDPSKAASYTTGETSRGGFTLDKNNNLILNDVYDFPDYDESYAKGTYMQVHNLFEPRGDTGQEGFGSGIFSVSPENTRKMTINLGKAPKDIIQMLQPQYIAGSSSDSVGSVAGGG